jgi:ATP-dependent DNA helicase Q1
MCLILLCFLLFCIFNRYYYSSRHLHSSSNSDALTPCGHCDNCTRDPSTVETKDVTREAWQLFKIVQAVTSAGGNLTMSNLAHLARGNKGRKFDVTERQGEEQTKKQEKMDLDDVCDGKVKMKREVRLFCSYPRSWMQWAILREG